MVAPHFDPTVAKPVIWSPAPPRLHGEIQHPRPDWVTSLTAAGLVVVVFTLSLLILAALLLPGRIG